MKHEIPQLLWLRDVWTMSIILADALSFQEFSPLGKWELNQPQVFPTPSDGVGRSAKLPASHTGTPGISRVTEAEGGGSQP